MPEKKHTNDYLDENRINVIHIDCIFINLYIYIVNVIKGVRIIKKNIIFAPETFNLAETTRSIEVAKKCSEYFHCIFIG